MALAKDHEANIDIASGFELLSDSSIEFRCVHPASGQCPIHVGLSRIRALGFECRGLQEQGLQEQRLQETDADAE